MSEDKAGKLTITIRTKTKELLKTEGRSVSATNDIGPFDILPDHANFVAIVNGEMQIVGNSGNKTKITYIRSLMRVAANVVDVIVLDE